MRDSIQEHADLSSALMGGPGLFCVFGSNGEIQQPSRGLGELLGLPDEELIGSGWLEFVHARDRQQSVSGAAHFTNRMRRRDGQYSWLEWHTAHVGEGYRMYVIHDVTAHKVMERRLTTELAVGRALVESTSLVDAISKVLEAICQAEEWQVGGLWWVDSNADQIECQILWHAPEIFADEFDTVSRRVSFPRGEALPGYAWDAGKPIWPEDIPADDCFCRLPIVSRNGLRDACAFPIRRGNEVVGVIAFHGSDVGPLDATMREMMYDIGEQIEQFVGRTQAEQNQSGLRLFEADRLVELGSLAGGLAHQINNALTYMRLGLGRLVSLELSRKPATPIRLHRIELLQDVREGVSRIERIIHQLENFSRMEDRSIVSIDVADLLDSVLRVAAPEIRHRARLVCDYRGVSPVQGNEGRLRQVFLHLLINAAQAIPEGEAHLNEIGVTACTGPDGCVVISVKDSGMGIAPEMLGRIFEPFFTTKPAGQGIGLGLSICHDMVAALDGEISVESVLGQGTTVRVTLPSSNQRVASVPVPSSQASVAVPSETLHGRILIIDDDRPVAAAVALELGNHDVVVAGSGREALHILEHDKEFDVILCDLIMPEITGMDVYESIKVIDPALAERFAFMTGGAFTTPAGRFLAEVTNPRIDKPFEPNALHALVRRIVARRAQYCVGKAS